MRRLLLGLALGAITPLQVQACAMDPYPNAVVFASKAEDIPDDAVALRVSIEEWPRGSYGFIAEVLDGPSSIEGKTVRIMPEVITSCGTFGRMDGYVVVRRQPVRLGGIAYLSAVVYSRSWRDELFSLFGADPYSSPGESVEHGL